MNKLFNVPRKLVSTFTIPFRPKKHQSQYQHTIQQPQQSQQHQDPSYLKPITVEEIQTLAKHTVLQDIPGETVEDKKAFCVKHLTQLLETYDCFIPVIGTFLENPISDEFEKKAVELLVDWAWEHFGTEDKNF
jgi:hypothetical protein